MGRKTDTEKVEFVKGLLQRGLDAFDRMWDEHLFEGKPLPPCNNGLPKARPGKKWVILPQDYYSGFPTEVDDDGT